MHRPPDEVVPALLDVFRTRGYSGATLSDIAEATGLARASLYHRYPGGKAEMAEAVMREVLAWLAEHVVAPLEDPSRPPRQRVATMTRALDRFYAQGMRPCLLDALSLGSVPAAVQSLQQEALTRWRDSLAHVARAAGVPRANAARQAEEALAMIQGALILARVEGSPRPFQRATAALPARLLDA